jgi:predicted Zn-dependent peptidase
MTSSYAFFGTRYGSVDNTFKTDEKSDFITVPDGIAHFLEHKLFANEDGSDSFEHFSMFGADANAYTSFDKTTYYFGCTENFFESLRELLTFVTHPYFTEESVAKERGIIEQEISMYDDNPSDRCFYGMLEGLYEKHSIKRNICGSAESIAKITPALLYDCYGVFYDLSNMVLAVSGDLDFEEILNLADEILPKESSAKKIIRSNENLLERKEALCGYTEQKMNVATPIFSIGIKDTDIPDSPNEIVRKDALMYLLNEMLFSASTEFVDGLLDRDMIYPPLRYSYNISEGFAFNSISGKADDPKQVYEEILAYLEKVKNEGLCAEDFTRAKRVIYAEFVKMFDSTENIANQLFSYGCDRFDILLNYDMINSITFEEVSALLQEAFKEEYMTLSVVYPLEYNPQTL